MEIDEYIKQLEDEAVKQNKAAATARALKERFPDIKVHKNRWGRIRLTSDSVNAIANEVEIHHSCGCCADSPLYVTPVCQDHDTKVHGTVEIRIGETWGYGDVLDSDWEEKLRSYNVNDVVIEKVRVYAEENKPEDYDDDDDEEEF